MTCRALEDQRKTKDCWRLDTGQVGESAVAFRLRSGTTGGRGSIDGTSSIGHWFTLSRCYPRCRTAGCWTWGYWISDFGGTTPLGSGPTYGPG